MSKLNHALLSCLLLTAILFGLRLMQLASAVEDRLMSAGFRISATATRLDATLTNAEALLASLRSTAEAVRRSSTSQLGYYESIGRRSARLLAEATLLVRHTDGNLRQLTDSTTELMTSTTAQTAQLGEQLRASADAAKGALESATRLAESAQARVQQPDISATIANLSTASEHIARTSELSEQALQGIRDIVSPARKGFWRRLLEAFIPRPVRTPAAP